MSHLNKTNFAIKILTNVLLISLFICIFFFTYGSYIEHKILESQIDFLSLDIMNNVKLFGENINSKFKEKLLELTPPDLSNEDENVKNENHKILIKALVAIIFFTTAICSIIYFLYNKSKKDFNIKTIIYQNLILLLFVALTEILFITFFVADYITINTNNVKYNIVQNIEKIQEKVEDKIIDDVF
jgi:hypothetical protein